MSQQTASTGPAHRTRPVHGLDASRGVARSHSRRRRRSNAVTTGALTVLVVGAVSAAGYFAWTEFVRDEPDTAPAPADLTPAEAIEILEEQPLWNGPGNPTFGIGDEP